MESPQPQRAWQWLLLLNEDQIDYAALDTGTLVKLVTSGDEPYIATSAFGELCRRDREQARTAAGRILADPGEDKWLRSHAFGVAVRESWLPDRMPEFTGPRGGALLVALLDMFDGDPDIECPVAETTRLELREAVPLGRAIEWLRLHWVDMSHAEAVAMWREDIRLSGTYAANELAHIDTVLADPPDNIVELLVEHVWLTSGRLHEAGLRDEPYGADPERGEALAWLRWMRDEFGQIVRAECETATADRSRKQRDPLA